MDLIKGISFVMNIQANQDGYGFQAQRQQQFLDSNRAGTIAKYDCSRTDVWETRAFFLLKTECKAPKTKMTLVLRHKHLLVSTINYNKDKRFLSVVQYNFMRKQKLSDLVSNFALLLTHDQIISYSTGQRYKTLKTGYKVFKDGLIQLMKVWSIVQGNFGNQYGCASFVHWLSYKSNFD